MGGVALTFLLKISARTPSTHVGVERERRSYSIAGPSSAMSKISCVGLERATCSARELSRQCCADLDRTQPSAPRDEMILRAAQPARAGESAQRQCQNQRRREVRTASRPRRRR